MDKVVTKVLNESWDFLKSVPTFALKTWEETTHGSALFIITIVLLFLISYSISVFVKYKGD